MPYNRNKPIVAAKPVDPKKVDRRRDESLKIYQDKITAITSEVRTLEAKKKTLDATLQNSYEQHQEKINRLYNELETDRHTFQRECHQKELNFIDQQRIIDQQQANFETSKVSISDAKMDLVEKENELITFGNELNAQQQIIENDKEYVKSVEESNAATKFEMESRQQELTSSSVRCQKRKDEILKMELDLANRIKQHDQKLAEVKLEIEKLEGTITDYQKIQGNSLVSQAERREFDAEVKTNTDHATQLKQTNIDLQNKHNELMVKEKSLHTRDKEIQQRLKIVQELERQHGGSNYGRQR